MTRILHQFHKKDRDWELDDLDPSLLQSNYQTVRCVLTNRMLGVVEPSEVLGRTPRHGFIRLLLL